MGNRLLREWLEAAEPRLDRYETPAPAMPRRLDAGFEHAKSLQFSEMAHAYRSQGGLAYGDEVARAIGRHCDQPISILARLIVERSIVHIAWRGQILVPLFQFHRSSMTPRASVAYAIAELARVFDDWELALWFAQPNSWLADRCPCELAEHDESTMVQAARADRFIARG